MNEEPKILASISGGKDSLAALITHIESGGRCDGAVYCRILFDDETSAEYPKHEDFLFNKCLPTLEREYGIKTTIAQQSYTYVERFNKVPQLFSGFLDFLSVVFPFIPSEITLLLTFGVVAVVFIGIIKAIRR